MELFTNSRGSCFRRCRREHDYKYNQGIRPLRVAAPLGFGRMFHDGVENWRMAVQEKRDKDACLALALAAVKASWMAVAPESDELNEYELAKAEEMMLGYHFRWYDDDSSGDWQYVVVEGKFETALRNPMTGAPSRTFRLSGKIDAIGTRAPDVGAPRNWLMETKTTSADISPGSDYWKRLRIDGQVSTYYIGAESLGYPVAGCLYDVARKPSLQPAKATPEEQRAYTLPKACKDCVARFRFQLANKKYPAKDVPLTEECPECRPSRLYSNMRADDETVDDYRARLREAIAEHPEAYFTRGTVARLESDLREACADIWMTAKAIRDCQLHDAHPRNPDACVRYSRFCDFFDVCTGAAAIDDPHRFRQSDVIHPELAEEGAA